MRRRTYNKRGAGSESGRYMIICNTDGIVYFSSDYGASWAEVKELAGKMFYGAAISLDGEYITLIEQSGNIYLGRNKGTSWRAEASGLNRLWVSVAMSSDGKYQTAVTSGDNIFLSSNFGEMWTAVGTSFGKKQFSKVTMCGDGKYQAAIYGASAYLFSSDFGKTWAAKYLASGDGAALIGFSFDGKHQTAISGSSFIYVSHDYGASFAKNPNKASYISAIHLSSMGDYQVAISYSTYQPNIVSSDFGDTWGELSTATDDLNHSSMSNDGKIIIGGSNVNVLKISRDKGKTFTDVPFTGYKRWTAVALNK